MTASDSTIPNLPSAGTITGAEYVPIDQSGTTVKSTLSALFGRGTLQSLTYAATIPWAATSGNMITVTLTGNATLSLPTGIAPGYYTAIIKQDAVGGHTLAFASGYVWVEGGVPVVSSGANAVTVLSFMSDGISMYGLRPQEVVSMAALRACSGTLSEYVEVRSYYQGGTTGGGKWQSNSTSTAGWFGTASISGNTVTIASTTNGAPFIGMKFNYAGSDDSRYLTAGSGTSWTISGTPLTLATQVCTGSDGGTYEVALDGMRWNRINVSRWTPALFGAYSDGVTASDYQIQAAHNSGYSIFYDIIYVFTGTFPFTVASNTAAWSNKTGGLKSQNSTTAKVGEMFTIVGGSNFVIYGLLFEGYQNSWAIRAESCTNFWISENRCQNIMLFSSDSSLRSGGYAAVTDASLSDSFAVDGNQGYCTIAPAAQSQAFIHFMYAKNWSGTGNFCDGYRECISWWGGDAAVEGTTASNARKCYNGTLTGNHGVNLTGAGIWGSMGQDINVIGGSVHGASGAGESFGNEGGTDITFTNIQARGSFGIGAYVNQLHQGKTQFINSDIKLIAGSSTWLLYNESSTFYADLGDIVIKGGRYESSGALAGFTAGMCRQWIMEDVDVINALPQPNGSNMAALDWRNLRIQTSYAPALPVNSTWFVYISGFITGFTIQPATKATIDGFRLEHIGTKVAGGRGLGIATGAANVDIEIDNFEFINIDSDLTFENTGGGNCTTIVHDGVCNSSASYPAVSYNTANHTVVWQDVRNELGQDAYGSPTASNLSAFIPAPTSRLWNNSPGIGKPAYWVKDTSAWRGRGYPDGSTVVASLPTAASSSEGATAAVTDATATTFLSAVAGGGTNHVPVKVINGAWVIA